MLFTGKCERKYFANILKQTLVNANNYRTVSDPNA